MELKPIKKRKRVYQDIIDQIKFAVEEGEIKPGEKLPSERFLAEALCVSRTSVKEAITVLESSGIIKVRPGVGMFLNKYSKEELLVKLSQIIVDDESNFKYLIELRQAIEADAAYYAASRITAEKKEQLSLVYNKLITSEERAEVAIEEDYQFHITIVESAYNPVMLQVMNLLSDKIIKGLRESREDSIKDELLNKSVLKEHSNIYKAIMNNDSEKARQAMWEHHQGIKHRHIENTLSKDGKRIWTRKK